MWGQHLILDLSGCPKEKIGDGDNILAWVKALVPAIDMVAYGEPILEHFATHKDETAGYSLVQLIETSNIAAHFAENIGQVYIDIFSCKDFDEAMATKVCTDFLCAGQCPVKRISSVVISLMKQLKACANIKASQLMKFIMKVKRHFKKWRFTVTMNSAAC